MDQAFGIKLNNIIFNHLSESCFKLVSDLGVSLVWGKVYEEDGTLSNSKIWDIPLRSCGYVYHKF